MSLDTALVEHLSKIPSSQEIGDSGIDVGDNIPPPTQKDVSSAVKASFAMLWIPYPKR